MQGQDFRIDYGESYFYRQDPDAMYNLLTDAGVDVWTSDDFSNWGRWEIRCDDAFHKLIAKLEKLAPNKVAREPFKTSLA